MINSQAQKNLEEIKVFIDNLDFSLIIDKLTRPDTDITNIKNVWSLEKAKYHVQQYKNYLFLIRKYSSEYTHIPRSNDIDEIWHHHILDTRKYQEHCHTIFGYYLHHDPYFGLNGEEDRNNLFSTWDITQELYLKEFGEYIYEYDEDEK